MRLDPSVRAVLTLVLVMIAVTVVSATAVLIDLRQREIDRARREAASLTRILTEQTTRTFEGVTLALQGVRDRLAERGGSRLTLDSEVVCQLLQARVAGLPQVKSIFVADGAGVVRNSSRPDFVRNLAVSDREFFAHFSRDGGDGFFVSGPEQAKVDGQWTFYVSTRLADASGTFGGVLVAAVSIDYFESLYDGIGTDFVSQIRLLDGSGQLLAAKTHDDTQFGKVLAETALLAELRGLAKDQALARTEQAGESRWYYAYRRVDKYPLVISVGVAEDQALTPWRRVLRPVAVGVGMTLLFVIGVSLLLVRNLSRKGALEKDLRESDEQLRHMVQSVSDAIVTVDAGKQIVLFNRAAETMFDVPASQAIGRDVSDLLAGCLKDEHVRSLRNFMEAGLTSPAGLKLVGNVEVDRGGREFPVELSLSTSTFRGATLLTAVLRDLSERLRAEQELLESNRQLQALSASLQNVREEERARISRELHDELGQLLTGIRLEVSWLGGRLLPNQEDLAKKVGAIKLQIDQTVASVRRLSSELRPLVLDDLGFDAAASWYADQFFQRTGVPVRLSLSGIDPPQGGVVATALFRVLQESLTNVARHAECSAVDVTLDRQAGYWILTIADDGRGFECTAARPGGIGLIGMRERIQMLGGAFAVTSAPGQGTTVEARVPVDSIKVDR